MTTNKTWKYQKEDGLSLELASPTDARGLRLRAECGYTHVNMGDGWLQIQVAIRKVDLAERMAVLK